MPVSDDDGYCLICGAPLKVLHTRSHTCRACQMYAAKLRQRLPPWDVIEANIDRIVAKAILEGTCYAHIGETLTGPVMGRKI